MTEQDNFGRRIMIATMSNSQLECLQWAQQVCRLYFVEYNPNSGNLTVIYRIDRDFYRDVVNGDGNVMMTGVVDPESLFAD